VIISSASSKTALAAAFLLSWRPEVRLVVLTSARNREFVEGLGIYGDVVTYDEVPEMAGGTATFVDCAGDGGVREAVHKRFGDDLVASFTVGMTHWDQMGAGSGGELPGPEPQFFFAPDRVTKRSKDWGREILEARVAEAWHPFCDWTAGWLEPIRGKGFEAVRDAYLQVLAGGVPPQRAHVLTLP